MTTRNRQRLQTSALLVAATAIGSLIMTTAEASVPDAAGEIHACYTTASTALRPFFLIDPARTMHCPTGFSSITLNQTGSRGPAGPVGPSGSEAIAQLDPPDQTWAQAGQATTDYTVDRSGFYYIAATATVRLTSGRCSDTVAVVNWDTDAGTGEVTSGFLGAPATSQTDGHLVYLDSGTHRLTFRFQFSALGGGQNCSTAQNSAQTSRLHLTVAPI